MKKLGFLVLFVLSCYGLIAQELQTNISVHDPVMAKQGDTYYLFCTGNGISVWSSIDLKNWKKEKPVFGEAPKWAVDTIPGFKGHIWAPDISFYNGKYYLYYSVSAFGKNTSAIGLATNTTLNPADANFKWEDKGRVIQSYPSKTNWNAIDPHLVADKKGNAYLSFGSFWDGLKISRLTSDRLNLAEDAATLKTIASRKKSSFSNNPISVDDNSKDAGGNAIEAPFIFKKEKYYYLFASIDYCCKGPKSTYKIVVGRSKKITGPYLNKDGLNMAQAGGTLLLQGDEKWYGVGHNSVYTFNDSDYLVFHGYDATDKGRSKLRIEKLAWDKSKWPFVKFE